MIIRILLLASIVAATPALAGTEHHTYNYLSIARTETEIPLDFGVDDDELELETDSATLSFHVEGGALFQFAYADGEVTRILGIDPKDVGEDVDVKVLGVLVGGARYYGDDTSVWGGIGYTYTKVKTRFFGDTDSDGYQFGLGVRHSVLPMLEINGSGFFVHEEPRDFDESETDFEVTVGLRLRPIEHFSIGGSYARLVDNDAESVRVDARLEF